MRTAPRALREAGGRYFLESVGITVTPELAAALFADPREKIVTGGWQAGKSTEGAAEVWVELPFIDLTRSEAYRYWYIVPSYEDPSKELDYLYGWALQKQIVTRWHRPEKGAIRLELLGGRVIIETKTGQNVAAISGEACDGVVIVETGQQAEAVRDQAQGRVMARDGWITQTGTLEDDANHPRWAHYAENAQKWYEHPTPQAQTFRLPSWANPIYSGERDARIEALRQVFDAHTFNRRVAAIPAGVQYQVYPQGTQKPYLLREMPSGLVWIDGAGGVDYGTAHPSSLTATTTTLLPDGRRMMWVRENIFLRGMAMGSSDAGDSGLITGHRAALMERHWLPRWGADPNERFMASIFGDPDIAVRTGEGSRQGRIGLLTRRLNADLIAYDINGSGVTALFEEQGRVHYRKTAQGELVLDRVNDDRTASLEDAVEAQDGLEMPIPTDIGDVTSRETGTEKPKPSPNRFTEPELRREPEHTSTRSGADEASGVRRGAR